MARLRLDLKDFSDDSEIRLKRGKKPRRTARGAVEQPKPKPSGGQVLAPRDKMIMTVRKVPEVMVKITRGRVDPATGERRQPCKDRGGIKAHFDYISRNGAVELEDETGTIHVGRESVADVVDGMVMTGARIPDDDGRRREVFSIVLSMPAGTDRAAVKAAARAFAADQFSDHQYVFAAHDDEKHPHVHLAVKAADRHGLRLNPRKADLQQWRELFAQKLRDQGIEANATPRRIRGVVRKPEKQAVRSIRERGGESKAYAGQVADAVREAQGGVRRENPAQDSISATRQAITRMYGQVAKTLVKGDDQERALALDIVQFVKTMPTTATLHDALVEQQRRRPGAGAKTRVPEKDREQGPERGE